MKFQPKTEKEIAEAGLLPVGVYPFEVLEASDSTSKAGNGMIVLDILIHAPDGSNRKLTDYLLEAMAFKLYHFSKHHGLIDKYQAGSLTAEDCIGRSGWVKLGIQKGKPKPDGGGDYPDRNSVATYVAGPDLPPRALVPPKAQQPTEAPLGNLLPAGGPDEDVPF